MGSKVPNTKTKPASPKKKTAAKSKKKTNSAQRRPQGTCFVLMPFKEPFDTYFSSIIEPAILATHLAPLRGDSLFRPSPIMADVWQMIQDAKVLVAELTEKNANVFYELGLAHALGKPVILISETIDDVPFDLQPLRVILYNKSDPAWGARLKTNLVSSLDETLGDLPRAVPPMFRKIVKSQAPEESSLEVRLYDLERRVAAMGPLQPELFSNQRAFIQDSDRDVFRYRGQNKEINPTLQGLNTQSDFVVWTIKKMQQEPLSIVRRRLREMLPSLDEVERVLDLAAKVKQNPKTMSTIDDAPKKLHRRMP